MAERRVAGSGIVKRNTISARGRYGDRSNSRRNGVSLDPRLRDPQALAALRTVFRRDGAVAVSGALTPASLRALRAMISRGVTRTSVPDRYSYGTMPLRTDIDDIVSFIKSVVGSSPKLSMLSAIPFGSVARFGHRDYTLLHDGLLPAPARSVVAFVVIDDWDPSFGGDIVWTRDGETLARLSPVKNTMYLVREEIGSRMFVKYVNHSAGRRLLRIIPIA